MKNLIYLLLFTISFTAFSQQKAIEITNIKKGTVTLLEENQRVKIRTLDGKKFVGNLTFSDSETLLVDGQSIKLDSLKSIKIQPKKLQTIKNVVLITGLAVIGTSIIVASGGGNAAFLLFTIGGGATIGGGLIDSINCNHSNFRNTFKIVANNATN